MIDKKKLKVMAALAREEMKSETARAIITVRAYRSDYLIKHGISAFVMGSIVFLIAAGIYALFHLERVTTVIFTDEFMRGFNDVIVSFGIFITVFVGVNVLVFNFKYSRYYKKFLEYRRLQRELINMGLEAEEDDKAS